LTLTFDPERLKAKTDGIVQFLLPSGSYKFNTVCTYLHASHISSKLAPTLTVFTALHRMQGGQSRAKCVSVCQSNAWVMSKRN